jgi:NAD(P)H-dependent flavin oxidoreductase YrpB (nitropropane dioxygenase family)
MSITTPVTQLLGINHPILLAPMDLVADGRLVAAVDAAGGFGILGGGYGEGKWLVRELDLLDRSKARFGVGFITWSLAKQPRLLDALMLGAAGVLMGIRFYASQEAAGAQGAKERIRGARCEELSKNFESSCTTSVKVH